MEARGFVDDLEAWPYVPAAGPTDWLCEETGCVAVWERGILGTPNAAQRSTLRELKLAASISARVERLPSRVNSSSNSLFWP